MRSQPLPHHLPWHLRHAFPAKITGGTGPFDWIAQQVKTDGTAIDDPRPGMSGTGCAYDLTGAEHAAGAIVWLCQTAGKNADGRPIYLIVSGGVGTAVESIGQYRGQVHAMVADDEDGWDWVQFTPWVP